MSQKITCGRKPAGLIRPVLLALLLSSAATGAFTKDIIRYAPYPQETGGRTESVTVETIGTTPGNRTFRLTTTTAQRENGPSSRTIREIDGAFTDTGNALFDALFALSLDDARLDSVTSIKDDAYNGGQPIDCYCFETGEKWHYVWTRDLSYALDLGLADLDSRRAATSLLFKTSAFRPGIAPPKDLPAGSTQIIQDTGSGGSWPISSDRTTWALGAERTLDNMEGAARDAFARKAYAALTGTVEADRIAIFDDRDGLYRGEHSFLDWREQTYAPWVVDHLDAIGQSKALSTNITQYRAMRLTARLAREFGDTAAARRYDGWADSLRQAINTGFWMPQAGLYATFTTADAYATPIEKYDLLGNDLAILSGVADMQRARIILSRYPFAPFGPPVVWPEAPDMFIYHNRAMWPFVTAFTIRAAAQVGHVEAADHGIDAMMRGAALNLSNMENLEWLTGKARFDDGPNINSRRQLWSVAGYYGTVAGTIFGWQPEADGVHVMPFLTTRTRAMFLGDMARLSGLRYKSRPVEIRLELPPQAPEGGVYSVSEIRLNGQAISGAITADQLNNRANIIQVRFGNPRMSSLTVTPAPQIDALSHNDPRAFMPATPALAGRRDAHGITLDIAKTAGLSSYTYTVLRDGLKVAAGVTDRTWIDPAPKARAMTACYSIIAYNGNGLASQPSFPVCLRGEAAQTIGTHDPRISLSQGAVASSTLRLGLGQTLTVNDVTISAAGTYAFAAIYDNHVYAMNTGITNAVKRLTLIDDAGHRQSAILLMPHIRPENDQHPLRESTRAYLDLAPGRYRIEISDFFNMSTLASNAVYGNPGGASGPVNEAFISELKIDRID